MSDTKLRGDWKVVQEIKPRNLYDVVETEEDTREEHVDIAYQQEEQLAVNGITHNQNESVSLLQLDRRDVTPLEVNLDVVNNLKNFHMGDNFVVDDESDGEDDTLINYYSEHEDTESSDDDTDIEA